METGEENDKGPRHRLSHSSLAAACPVNEGVTSHMLPPQSSTYHAAMMDLLPPLYAEGRRIVHEEFYPHAQHASLLHPEGPPRWLEPLLPPPIREQQSTEFAELFVGEKRKLSGLTVEEDLYLTPPMAPVTTLAGRDCLSPFELDEKRPPKLQSTETPIVPLKPTLSLEDLSCLDPRELPVFVNDAAYADFFDCLLAF